MVEHMELYSKMIFDLYTCVFANNDSDSDLNGTIFLTISYQTQATENWLFIYLVCRFVPSRLEILPISVQHGY